MRILNKGEYFGEGSLFNEPFRFASAYADSFEIIVLAISKNSILKAFGDHLNVLYLKYQLQENYIN